MVIKLNTGAIQGGECKVVEVEVDVSTGLPCFEMIGNLSGEVKEAKERVRVALQNNGYQIPARRITVNISPANIRKEGTSYDMPIAVGLLTAMELIPENILSKVYITGELGLNGEVKAISGALPMVLTAKEYGFRWCLIPKDNMAETEIVQGIKTVGITNLQELVAFLQFYGNAEEKDWEMLKWNNHDIFPKAESVTCITKRNELNFSDVYGQENVKRVMEIASAGFHNLLMIGPPGSGKSMSARRIPSIMPDLSLDEKIEVSKIYSVSGLLNEKQSLIHRRPFMAPHHTISQSAFAGGGRYPRPGQVSLAHKGILYLDETPHFPSSILEILRQPMEDKEIQINRNGGNYVFPADFMLVVAMNPCPCGYFPDMNRCKCTPEKITRYLGKISGPLLDRIDLCVETNRLDWKSIKGGIGNKNMTLEMRSDDAELSKINSNNVSGVVTRSSEEMKGRVMLAREMQLKRYEGTDIRFNSELKPAEIAKYIELTDGAEKLMEKIYEKYNLSARAYHKLIKVARTVADLEQLDVIDECHVLEVLNYRSVEEKYWG